MATVRRFLTLAEVAEVAEELATSVAQVTALVQRGELRAMKLGGRGQCAMFEWIEEFYNPVRRHSGLGYRSPVEFEDLHKIANPAA